MEKMDLIIDGKTYSYVKTRNHMPVSVYKGTDCYLRIGPEELISKEVDYHKNLLKFGFPMPQIIKEGWHEGLHYFIESSLGDKHFSQIFKDNISDKYTISDSDFTKFLMLIKRYTEAQLDTASDRKFIASEFESMIQYGAILKELPLLEKDTTKALRKAEGRIKNLPIVITHGDFNPHNILEAGVIDWERGSYAPFGYDLVTNVSQIFFFPLSGDFEFVGGYRFSKRQISEYWQEIDALCVKRNVPKISAYVNDFIFCRAIWSVVHMDRWPKIQAWRNQQYKELIDMYLKDADLTEFLSIFQEITG